MKYYFKSENRIITTEELVRKYGSFEMIPQLGMYELSVQPSYEPVGFNDLGDGTYYPVESYDSMKSRGIDALVKIGYTPEAAATILA